MNLSVAMDGARAVVRLDGRLDGEWAEHVSDTLTDLLREGTRSVILDMSMVQYASSAATTVLVRRGQDFAALRGQLLLASPSPSVRHVLTVAGLGDRILQLPPGAGDGELRSDLDRLDTQTREWRSPLDSGANPRYQGRYEVTAHERGATLGCRVYGRPEHFARGLGASDCEVVTFSDRAFGLGIGAIGDCYESCQRRMGELVSAAGVVAYMPTDGAHVADFLAGAEGHEPHAVVGPAVVCEGSFSHLARFAMRGETGGVPLSELCGVLLSVTGGDSVGIVMVAESAGLVGAWLRRSPAAPNEVPTFRVPAVRSWLSLSADPTHAVATAVVVGVATRAPASALAPHVRSLGGDGRVPGHFHAVVFSYAPVPQRTIAMETVVASLFEHQRVRGVMHLMHDDRARVGAGESVFRRGLIWAAPIESVTAGNVA